MTRRLFIAAAVGLCAPKNHLVLEAIAAERMPDRLFVSGVTRAAFFELRDYGSTAPLLPFEPVLNQKGKMLFAFDTLADRERAWREHGTIEANRSLRKITIYRCV